MPKMRNEDGQLALPRMRLSREPVSEEEKKRRLCLPLEGKVPQCAHWGG